MNDIVKPKTVKEAAIIILQEAGKPLHVREITERILLKKLWQSDGKTPIATVAALIYSDIKKHGSASTFTLVSPQTFGLHENIKSSQIKSILDKSTISLEHSKKKIIKNYSFNDAAERILEQIGNKEPMHYRTITEKALEMDLLSTEGKTPEATMYAQIITEIKRYQKRGEQPRFVQLGKGFIGLSRWSGRGLAFEIEQHNKKIRQTLHKRIMEMTSVQFEELIARLLAEIGFDDIEITKRTSDGGIDVRGTLVVGEVIRTRMAVQVKKWKIKNRVQSPVVQQVRGSLGTHEQGLIITTSDFSHGARDEAARSNAVPVGLMNGEQLVMLLVEYNIGIKRTSHDLIEIEE